MLRQSIENSEEDFTIEPALKTASPGWGHSLGVDVFSSRRELPFTLSSSMASIQSGALRGELFNPIAIAGSLFTGYLRICNGEGDFTQMSRRRCHGAWNGGVELDWRPAFNLTKNTPSRETRRCILL